MRWYKPPNDDYDMVLFAYLRLSKGQAGIARQQRAVQTLAERHNAFIICKFVDKDRTAFVNPNARTVKQRDDYQAMLAEIKKWDRRKPLGIVAYHAARLHREIIEAKTFMLLCREGGHLCLTDRTGNYNFANNADRTRFLEDALRAEHEVDQVSERWRDQKKDSAREGRWLGGVTPFGWKAKRLKDDTKVLKLDKEAAKAIRWATREVLDSPSAAEANLSAIAREWTRRGVKSPNGGTWNNTMVRKMLVRARNAGLMEHLGKVVETNLEGGGAAWPAIVSEAEWRAVVEMLTAPERRSSPGPRPKWLGSGLYRCGAVLADGSACMGPMRAADSYEVKGGDGEKVIQYRCRGTGPKDGTRHVVRVAPMLDAWVSAVLVERLNRKDVRRVLAQYRPADVKKLERDIKVEEANLQQWRRQLDAEDDDEQLSPAAFARMENKILKRIDKLKADAAAARQNPLIAEILAAEDFEALWREKEALGAECLPWRRGVLDLFATVVVLPARKGRTVGWRPGMPYFDPETVGFEWKPLGGRPAPA